MSNFKTQALSPVRHSPCQWPMRKVTFLSILCFCLACGDTNDFDPDEDPLTGQIGGEEWAYVTGNAYFDYSSSGYVSGKLMNFDSQDPCAWRSLGVDHIEVTFPARLGTYDLTSGSLSSSNYGKAVFRQFDTSQNLSAFGFIQLVKISGNEIIGYLNAGYDDDNQAQGTFRLVVCN